MPVKLDYQSLPKILRTERMPRWLEVAQIVLIILAIVAVPLVMLWMLLRLI